MTTAQWLLLVIGNILLGVWVVARLNYLRDRYNEMADRQYEGYDAMRSAFFEQISGVQASTFRAVQILEERTIKSVGYIPLRDVQDAISDVYGELDRNYKALGFQGFGQTPNADKYLGVAGSFLALMRRKMDERAAKP